MRVYLCGWSVCVGGRSSVRGGWSVRVYLCVCVSVCVCVVGRLYAVGGHDGNEHLKSGEVFDPLTNKWTAIAPMSKLRCIHHSLSLSLSVCLCVSVTVMKCFTI